MVIYYYYCDSVRELMSIVGQQLVLILQGLS